MYLLAERSPQRGIVRGGGRWRVDILCEPEFRAPGWEYQRTCTEGPVFDARQIDWNAVK